MYGLEFVTSQPCFESQGRYLSDSIGSTENYSDRLSREGSDRIEPVFIGKPEMRIYIPTSLAHPVYLGLLKNANCSQELPVLLPAAIERIPCPPTPDNIISFFI